MTSHRRHAVLLLLSALAAAGQTTAVLSDEPRIFLQPGFLTEEECEKLISLAASRLEVPLLRAADSDFELIEPSSETAVHQRAILEPDWELELPWLQSIVPPSEGAGRRRTPWAPLFPSHSGHSSDRWSSDPGDAPRA